METAAETETATVAADNDIVLKAACYRLADAIWPVAVGALGAAPYVLRDAVDRHERVCDKQGAHDALADFFNRAEILEPDDDELAHAAELERLAGAAGLELDAGESQLAAIAAKRGLRWLDTGDKRGVRALDELAGRSRTCAALVGRVRSVEHALARVIVASPDEFDNIARAVCAEPAADKTASICFSCVSGGPVSAEAVLAGLRSYIGALRTQAPQVLAP